MADYVTDFFKSKQQQGPEGPIGSRDQFNTPKYAGSPYAQPYQQGTNLPWSYQKNEPLPTWNGQRPVDYQGKATVNPQAVPLHTGMPGKYGGNIEWFDPTTGRVTDEYGRTKDSQLTAAGPGAWQALAALAAGNPGGMLSTQDFVNAQSQAYGSPNPNQAAEAAARKAAAGYPGYENHPAYRAPTAMVAPHWAQSRQQQAQRRAARLGQSTPANAAWKYGQEAPLQPDLAARLGQSTPVNAAPAMPTPASPDLGMLTQVFQALASQSGALGNAGSLGSTVDMETLLRQLFAALGR